MTDEEKDFALDRVALYVVEGIHALRESGDPATEMWIYRVVKESLSHIWENGYEWGHSDTEENPLYARLQSIKFRTNQTKKLLGFETPEETEEP